MASLGLGGLNVSARRKSVPSRNAAVERRNLITVCRRCGSEAGQDERSAAPDSERAQLVYCPSIEAVRLRVGVGVSGMCPGNRIEPPRRPLTVRSCESAGAAGASRRGCAPGYFYLRNLDQEICSTRATVFKFLSFFLSFFF
ncbi:hypothetical protein Nmel_000297 [Mimus melanotis]